MKDVRKSIPRILKINEVRGYKVSCLFNTGELRIIDFKKFFFNLKSYSKKHPAYKLMQDKKEFEQIEILGNTVGWKNTGIYSEDATGKTIFYHYDLDPIVLFEASEVIEEDEKNKTTSDWDSYFLYQIENGKSKNILTLCYLIMQDIKTTFELNDDEFSFGKTMITYYVNNKIFGNIRLSSDSLRIEPVFAGNHEIGYKIQTDGYIVHSFKMSTEKEYKEKKKNIFRLLKDVHRKKQNGEYEVFIDNFNLRLEKYLKRTKK